MFKEEVLGAGFRVEAKKVYRGSLNIEDVEDKSELIKEFDLIDHFTLIRDENITGEFESRPLGKVFFRMMIKFQKYGETLYSQCLVENPDQIERVIFALQDAAAKYEPSKPKISNESQKFIDLFIEKGFSKQGIRENMSIIKRLNKEARLNKKKLTFHEKRDQVLKTIKSLINSGKMNKFGERMLTQNDFNNLKKN